MRLTQSRRRETKMNQNEAAEYIEKRGIKMTPADMSRLAKFGAGPAFTKYRGRKNFRASDLDAWMSEERARRDRELDERESINAENKKAPSRLQTTGGKTTQPQRNEDERDPTHHARQSQRSYSPGRPPSRCGPVG